MCELAHSKKPIYIYYNIYVDEIGDIICKQIIKSRYLPDTMLGSFHSKNLKRYSYRVIAEKKTERRLTEGKMYRVQQQGNKYMVRRNDLKTEVNAITTCSTNGIRKKI